VSGRTNGPAGTGHGTVGGMVIVGAGECGARAAFALREAGWTGRITLVGAEDALPYERPPLSKAALLSDVAVPTVICDHARLRDNGIELVPGVEVTDLDRAAHEIVLADGRRVGYERLLLATGARPRKVPFAGPPVHLLRTHADAVALRQRLRPGARVGVIGGGFIGLEVAASASALGCAVTVVEMAPRLMGRAVPERVAAVVAARHAAAGIDVLCGTGVAGLAGGDGPTTIALADGGALVVDTVVAGVGAVPETSLARRAGLAVENGVRADSRLTTSDPDVFAAGDCCSFPHPLYDDRRIRLESWRSAQEQGTVAARNMLGADEPFAAVPWFWSDQHDLTVQVAGLTDAATEEVVRTRADGVELWFGLGPDGRLVGAAAVGTGNAVAKDIRLAEMLVARRCVPDPTVLADPAENLKTLLKRSPSSAPAVTA
jgi:3-phenylpropionate/trans-cinnamate dioxygenase ferredoxin reductase subunit